MSILNRVHENVTKVSVIRENNVNQYLAKGILINSEKL